MDTDDRKKTLVNKHRNNNPLFRRVGICFIYGFGGLFNGARVGPIDW